MFVIIIKVFKEYVLVPGIAPKSDLNLPDSLAVSINDDVKAKSFIEFPLLMSKKKRFTCIFSTLQASEI